MGHKQAKQARQVQRNGTSTLARRQRLVQELEQTVKVYQQAAQRIPFLQGCIAALNEELKEMEVPLPPAPVEKVEEKKA